MPYTVSTPVFEGPFDLLLHLISREQVDLWEVSLSDIVDRYVASLERMRAALDLEVATEFLLIAAVLLELKARRLLPGREDIEPEEELALWEERDLLLARLLECKTFKDAAGSMQRLMENASRSWARVAGPDERYAGLAPDLLAGVTPAGLRDAMQELLVPRPVTGVLLDHVAPVRISVRDAVDELLAQLPREGRVTFAKLAGARRERLQVIVTFLAVLELYKRGLVDLSQASPNQPLEVCWLAPDERPAEAESPDTDEYTGIDGFANVEEYQG